MKKITILNTSIITAYGSFDFEPITVQEARELVRGGFESAVGHQSTCAVLKTLLGVEVPVNRINYSQGVRDVALVFKLNERTPEGKVLTADEIEAIGYNFGLLTRTA